jgi:DNA end-binding protein Ku
MASSIFNAVLAVGELEIPVKLYSAVQPRGPSFRLLHEDDVTRVRQRFVHPKTGETVSNEVIRRGLELPQGTVAFTDAELAAFEPEPSRTIELVGFVDSSTLGAAWYDRPYYLGPTPDADARSSYVALARALASEAKLGLVRWTMRKHSYRGALTARGDHLILISLRAADEVVRVAELPRPEWAPASPQEHQMAEQLVAMLAGNLEIEQLRDHHRERVLEYIEAKIGGRVQDLPKPIARPAAAASLSDALAASIERAKERHVA